MKVDLINQYGILRPLAPEDFAELQLSLAAFEDDSGLVLAPFLLDALFLKHLREKTTREGDEWNPLWALVHGGETVIGFLDFPEAPDEKGTVELCWTINPEWTDSPFVMEALRTLVDYAFSHTECRAVRSGRSFRSSPEMDRNFLRLGFRKESFGDTEEYRLSKAVEGRLL